jgi:hypothetical protein
VNPSALLAAALLAAILPPAPAGSPSPEPAEKPLREIGSVRVTTPFCKKMIETAVDAVDLTLNNDVKIGQIAGVMRTADFDANQLVKHRSVEELRRRFASLRAAAVQGERALKQFKADAKAATDPAQRAALEQFADALAGALHRQQKLADNIGGYIAMLDASEPISEYDEAEMNLQHDLNVSNTRYQNSDPLKQQTPAPETLTHSARRAADELDLRLEPINKDEDDAANRIDPAFKRC